MAGRRRISRFFAEFIPSTRPVDELRAGSRGTDRAGSVRDEGLRMTMSSSRLYTNQ
jgi:hypothetical protein